MPEKPRRKLPCAERKSPARHTFLSAVLLPSIAAMFLSASANDDDNRNLIMSMEIEITIRNAAKTALEKARNQSRDAIEQTSLYARYKKNNSDALRLMKESHRISKEHMEKFSPAQRERLRRNELVSRGYPEVLSPRYRAYAFVCSATYSYTSQKLEGCRDLESDISSTSAGYALCVIHDAGRRLSGGQDCTSVTKEIAEKYPALKNHIDEEKESKKKERLARDLYLARLRLRPTRHVLRG